MPGPAESFVAGLVLAAGGSSRLGMPKQLLPFRSATLLDHTVGTARACGFDQLIVALGGSAAEVRSRVDLSGAEVVVNPDFGEGCSSSIAAAMGALNPRAGRLVLLVGDQPGVTAGTVEALLGACGDAPIAVCSYDDGPGHPFIFSRPLFRTLRALRGDKAVWKLVATGGAAVARVPVAGPVPTDVNTWADFEAVT
jgi:molybdenum cofactor cytidylyltransferase